MRDLLPAPDSIFDPATGRLRAGSFVGSVPRFDLRGLGPEGGLRRLITEKRWFYSVLCKEPMLIGLAIVDLGYALKAFVFSYARGERTLSVDRSVLALPGMGKVRQTDEALYFASVKHPAGRFHVELPRGGAAMRVQVKVRGLSVDAELDVTKGPPAITAIAPIERGVANATEKRVLLPLRGEAVVHGGRVSLDGGVGGFDYTHGLLARHTAWKWAFLLGNARSGERVAVNLVEGFVGEPECAVWVDDSLFGVGEGRFGFDLQRPLAPWSIRTTDGSVDLEFRPGAIHEEHENLLIASSQFLQPVGMFHGKISLPKRPPLEIDGALGVAESQDVRW